MLADVAHVQGPGIVPKAGRDQANRLALQRAIDGLMGAGGGTLLVPAGGYEFAGTIDVEVGVATSATGVVRIIGDSEPTLLHGDENPFVITDTIGNAAVGHVALEGLRFQVDSEAAGP